MWSPLARAMVPEEKTSLIEKRYEHEATFYLTALPDVVRVVKESRIL